MNELRPTRRGRRRRVLGLIACSAALSALVAVSPAAAEAPPDDEAAARASEVERVLARVWGGDLSGAARLLDRLAHIGEPAAQGELRSAVMARAGDAAAIGEVLLAATIDPDLRHWLVTLAARGMAPTTPAGAAVLADSVTDRSAGGRAATVVAASTLFDQGLEDLAKKRVEAVLGAPHAPLEGLPGLLVIRLPEQQGAAAEAERGFLLLNHRAAEMALPAFERALKLVEGGDPELGCLIRHGAAVAALRVGDGTASAHLRRMRADCGRHPKAGHDAVFMARLGYAIKDWALFEEGLAWLRALPHGEERARARGITALEALRTARGPLKAVADKVRARIRGSVMWDPVGSEVMKAWSRLVRRGKYQRAAKLLAPIADSGYHHERQRTWGQIDYWLARSLQSSRDDEGANEAYARAAERYPVSWYGLLALEALEERQPDRAAALRAALDAKRPPWPTSSTMAEPTPKTDAQRAVMRRMKKLWRWGLAEAIEAEARHAGLRDDPALAAWTAELIASAGAPGPAAGFAAGVLQAFGQYTPPQGPDVAPERMALWRAGWPRPFAEAVLDQADAEELDPYLLWSVMRIESLYKTTAVSWAGARGLLQLMPRTAAWLRTLKPPVGPEHADLFDPPDNVRLGAQLLRRLERRFDGHQPLMVAAYNAGSGRIGRLVRKARHDDIARFVEELEYTETRNYVRSVIGAYAMYHHLYGCRCAPKIAPTLTGPDADPEE